MKNLKSAVCCKRQASDRLTDNSFSAGQDCCISVISALSSLVTVPSGVSFTVVNHTFHLSFHLIYLSLQTQHRKFIQSAHQGLYNDGAAHLFKVGTKELEPEAFSAAHTVCTVHTCLIQTQDHISNSLTHSETLCFLMTPLPLCLVCMCKPHTDNTFFLSPQYRKGNWK